MKRNQLGQTGIEVSPITIGAWQLGGPLCFDGKPDGHPDPGKENVIRMIHELGAAGVNAIDTAEQYSAGESERRVGEALKGRRDQWVISSKFGFRVGPNNTRIDNSAPETIMPSLEGSLQRLGTDFIDIYLYHCPPDVENIAEGRAVLEQAKAQGKIRSYGISSYSTELVAEMVKHNALEVVQFTSSLLGDNSVFWDLVRENNLGTQVRGVMAQGRLSGRYFGRKPEFQSDDNRANGSDDFTRYASLAECVPEGYTMAQMAIRWVLDHPGCHTICMGAKNIADYHAAIAATELPSLSEDVRLKLEAAVAEL